MNITPTALPAAADPTPQPAPVNFRTLPAGQAAAATHKLLHDLYTTDLAARRARASARAVAAIEKTLARRGTRR